MNIPEDADLSYWDGEDPPSERFITEAEYLAWLKHAMPRIAEEVTGLLPQEARDAGIRFEWELPGSAGDSTEE